MQLKEKIRENKNSKWKLKCKRKQSVKTLRKVDKRKAHRHTHPYTFVHVNELNALLNASKCKFCSLKKLFSFVLSLCMFFFFFFIFLLTEIYQKKWRLYWIVQRPHFLCNERKYAILAIERRLCRIFDFMP